MLKSIRGQSKVANGEAERRRGFRFHSSLGAKITRWANVVERGET
jgi:hypothetical protein